jgi:hypothetical protein
MKLLRVSHHSSRDTYVKEYEISAKEKENLQDYDYNIETCDYIDILSCFYTGVYRVYFLRKTFDKLGIECKKPVIFGFTEKRYIKKCFF